MKIDLVFLIVFGILICYYLTKPKVEHMTLTVDQQKQNEDIKKYINDIYKADIGAIRKLSDYATKIYSEHNTKSDVLNVTNKNGLKVSKTKDSTGMLKTEGPLHADGGINIPNGGTINSAGRMHLSGSELLYLLNKSGVIIGKEWGGNGNLSVQGAVSTTDLNVAKGTALSGNLRQGNPGDPNWTGANFHRRDGRWSHLDWVGDQKNYIRGDTQLDNSLNIGGNLTGPNLNRVGGDWLRVNDLADSVGRTALYGNLSINDTKKGGGGGLSVGSWADVGQGNIKASGNIEGNVLVSKELNVANQARVTKAFAVGDGKTVEMGPNWTGANFKRRDGRWSHFDWVGDQKNYIRGDTQIDNNVNIDGSLNAGNANFRRRDGRWSHFDWSGDQKNYIRGDTQIDNNVNIDGRLDVKQLCMNKETKDKNGNVSRNNACIDADALSRMISNDTINIGSIKQGNLGRGGFFR